MPKYETLHRSLNPSRYRRIKKFTAIFLSISLYIVYLCALPLVYSKYYPVVYTYTLDSILWTRIPAQPYIFQANSSEPSQHSSQPRIASTMDQVCTRNTLQEIYVLYKMCLGFQMCRQHKKGEKCTPAIYLEVVSPCYCVFEFIIPEQWSRWAQFRLLATKIIFLPRRRVQTYCGTHPNSYHLCIGGTAGAWRWLLTSITCRGLFLHSTHTVCGA